MKRTQQQKDFIEKYVCNDSNNHKLYWKAFFHEDEDYAVVRRRTDYKKKYAWGCVNLSNEVILPFEFKSIKYFGNFLVAEDSDSEYLYDKNGNYKCEILEFEETEHEDYHIIFDESEEARLIFRKSEISSGGYSAFYVEENGLVFTLDLRDRVGIIYQNQIILPCSYEAISLPEYGFSLAIKKSSVNDDGEQLYECSIIEIKDQEDISNAVKLTDDKVFEDKEWDEIEEYFKSPDLLSYDLKKIISEGWFVDSFVKELTFYPADEGLPCHLFEKKDKYNPMSDYTINESLYDALGGDMDAIWNLD